VSKLNERVKKVGQVNTAIADWLQVIEHWTLAGTTIYDVQERRKVEEAYVAGLKKLAHKPLQEVGGDLG
jgi:hypothetical protein